MTTSYTHCPMGHGHNTVDLSCLDIRSFNLHHCFTDCFVFFNFQIPATILESLGFEKLKHARSYVGERDAYIPLLNDAFKFK